MSTTRLLVLGVVRIMQPAHGYLLRQELLSWNVQTWANVQPGSIYSALRTLTASGFLEEVGSQPTGSKAARTAYRLAATGEAEFLRLLREHLWQVDTIDGSWPGCRSCGRSPARRCATRWPVASPTWRASRWPTRPARAPP